MLQARREAGFPLDLALNAAWGFVPKQLDRHPPAQAAVLGEPNVAHTPTADEAFDPVAAFENTAFHASCSLSEQRRKDERASRGTFLRVNRAARSIASPARNIELLQLAAALAFFFIGWRALDASPVAPPAGFAGVAFQLSMTVLLGHTVFRLLAPDASPIPFAIGVFLAAVGLVMVARLDAEIVQAQANWISLGVVLAGAGAVAGYRYRDLRRQRYTAAALALALLLMTGILGTTINGARLWLNVGGQLVQSTELIKVLLVVFVAGYLADEAAVLSVPPVRFRARRYSLAPRLVPLVVALGAAIGALALLRDLGSIAILLLFAGGMLFIATGRLRYPLSAALVALVAAALGYVAFDHAQARIDTWLDPWADPGGSGYQSIQALYAIEAGGVTGTGLGFGDPGAIPAAATDYMFSAITEELGLAAGVGIALVYVLFLYGGLRIALDCPDRFGRLLAASVAVLIAIQAAVIIAGNLRLVPTTGITLPFISYGGSSLAVNFFLAGVLTGVSQASASTR